MINEAEIDNSVTIWLSFYLQRFKVEEDLVAG